MMLGPRDKISPSSAMATSTPAMGWPTVPARFSVGVFIVMIGLVSVSPYPWTMGTPKAVNDCARSARSAAPPVATVLTRVRPSFSRSLE